MSARCLDRLEKGKRMDREDKVVASRFSRGSRRLGFLGPIWLVPKFAQPIFCQPIIFWFCLVDCLWNLVNSSHLPSQHLANFLANIKSRNDMYNRMTLAFHYGCHVIFAYLKERE
jgi:hypothetical protein